MAQNGAPAAGGAAGGAAAPQAAPAAAWPVARIALIDIGHIFRNHPTMKSEQEAVESLAKSYQEELTKKRQELVKQFEALKQFKDDSLEFKQGEEKLAEAEAALQLDMGRKEKELVEKRAEVFYKNYQQVHTMVKWLAESQGIDMVITFNRPRHLPHRQPKHQPLQVQLEPVANNLSHVIEAVASEIVASVASMQAYPQHTVSSCSGSC
jgi:Skp family chaperone for outer membrane proteins